MTHQTLDQINLAQHKLIAKKLQANPEAILALALRNLQRYIKGHPRPIFGGSGEPSSNKIPLTGLSLS